MTSAASSDAADVRHDRLRRWWDDGAGGPFLSRELRRAPADAWTDALGAIPDDDGPEAVEPPDRPPARVVDLPEVLALRAMLMDRRVAFDTVDRWIRALTQSTRILDHRRPLIWTADHVASRMVEIAQGGEGSAWSTLEVVRELWAWHPDRPFVETQSKRLLIYLDAVLSDKQAGESAT